MTVRGALMATLILAAPFGGCAAQPVPAAAVQPLYGVMGRMIALPGQRERLIAILTDATRSMPGNRSYVVARDLKDANAVWISEVWDSRAAHAASLTLPQVQRAIIAARPLIAGFDSRVETEPVRAH